VPKSGDHYENDQYVITSAGRPSGRARDAGGHRQEEYGFWRLETLPIIPEKFGLKPIADSKSRYDQIKKLLARKDIDCRRQRVRRRAAKAS
jgi:DNA topoisomerase-3